MRVVIQRVTEASVSIAGKEVGRIGKGLMILLGIEDRDTDQDINYLVRKISNMRIFPDANGIMNESILEHHGEILLVSQFTLMAETKKGNRPSYIRASGPEFAIPMYEKFIATLQTAIPTRIQTGQFGADMQVALINDGPVTILMDTHEA